MSRATMMTAQALFCYSVGLWAIAGARTIVPAFYSLQDTWTPLKIALICLVANVRLYCHSYLSLETCGFGPGDQPFLDPEPDPSLLEVQSEIGRVEFKKDCPVLSAEPPLQPPHGSGLPISSVLWEIGLRRATQAKRSLLLGTGIGAGLGIYLMCSYWMKNEELLFLLKMARKRR